MGIQIALVGINRSILWLLKDKIVFCQLYTNTFVGIGVTVQSTNILACNREITREIIRSPKYVKRGAISVLRFSLHAAIVFISP